MPDNTTSHEDLARENERLRQRLEEAEALVHAVSGGEVDAFLVRQGEEENVLVLDGVDRPYRLLIERMQQGAVTLAADGTVLFANPSFADMLGRPLSGLVGRVAGECLAAGDWQRLRAMLDEGLAGDGSSGEFLLRRADGNA